MGLSTQSFERGTALRVALSVALLALGVRIAYFLIIGHGGLTYSDSGPYSALAGTLVTGSRYHIPSAGQLFPYDLIRPPGYPFLLALANGWSHVSVERSSLVQVAAGACAVGVLTYTVTRWLGLTVGLLAGLFLALDWATVLYTPLLLADFPLSIAYGGGIAAFVGYLRTRRLRWALVAGLCLGAGALIKPAGEFGMIAVLIAVLVSPRLNWRGGLACLCTFLIVVVPWAVRNQQKHGVFGLSTISTVNTYDFTAQVALRGPLLWTPSESLAISNRALNQMVALHLPPAELKSRMDGAAVRIILHHLPKAIGQGLLGAVETSIGTGRDTLAVSTRDRQLPWLVGTLIPLAEIVGFWFLGIVGAVTLWRGKLVPRSVAALLIGAVVLIILPAASPVANARFRVPAAPLLCVLAGVGAAMVIQRFRGPSPELGELERPVAASRTQMV